MGTKENGALKKKVQEIRMHGGEKMESIEHRKFAVNIDLKDFDVLAAHLLYSNIELLNRIRNQIERQLDE
jgi:hypothetical protein